MLWCAAIHDRNFHPDPVFRSTGVAPMPLRQHGTYCTGKMSVLHRRPFLSACRAVAVLVLFQTASLNVRNQSVMFT